MKWGIWIIVLLLVCLAAAAAYLYQDEDLDPALAELIENSAPAHESEAFVYLYGIHAAANEDPMEVGSSLLQEVRQAEAQWSLDHDVYVYEDYPEERRLNTPDSEVFCALHEASCHDLMGGLSEAELEELVSSNALLLERFQHLLALGDYRTLTRANVNEPLAPFQYLVGANRVYFFSLLLGSQREEEERQITGLYQHIAKLRAWSLTQDHLIGRMIATVMIGESINMLRLMCRGEADVCREELPALQPQERNLSKEMGRELAMAHAMMVALKDDRAAFSEDVDVPPWALRFVFKPNMTVNSMWSAYQNAIDVSNAPVSELSSLSQAELQEPQTNVLRNPVGGILAAVASPNYLDYVGRVFSLEAKIQLFNASLGDPSMERVLEQQKSPFFQSEEDAFLTEDARWICLPGPLPDHRNERCLPK